MRDEASVILLVEDSEEDFQTVSRLLGKIAPQNVERCPDAPAAIDYLDEVAKNGPGSARRWPSVILLDLNLPGEDGRSLLVRLKRDERFRRIPVVILTTSGNPRDLEYCYSNGAAGYITKPVDLANFRSSLEHMTNYWLRAVTLPPAGVVHDGSSTAPKD